MCPAMGVVGATKVVWVPAPEGGEEGGEDVVGMREEVLAGRMLGYIDDGDRGRVLEVRVVDEEGALSELMGEEAAAEGTALGWAVVAKTNPAEFVKVVAVESDLD